MLYLGIGVLPLYGAERARAVDRSASLFANNQLLVRAQPHYRKRTAQ